MVILAVSPPMRAVISSLTILTIIWAGVRDSSTSEPTAQRYTITVTLPEGRTEDKLLIITVNGETHEETVSPDDTTYSIVYEGTIYSCTAEIDGTEYPFSIEANSST